MSAETAMATGAIVLAFVVFAGVLAWADFYTRRQRGRFGPAE